MNELQWRELVERTKKGDKAAFETLYRETQRSVYFTSLKLLANEDNAKDITQDTFMTAIAKLGELDDGAKFPQWVNRIAVNKCRMSFRRAKTDSLDEQTDQGLELKDDESFIPEDYVTDEAKRGIIMNIINNVLSDVQRQTVIMYYYDEMTLEDIAEAMGCPIKTVSSRLVSAREKLREAVLIYERDHDDRLHALVPVPILTQILRMEAAKISVPDIPLTLFAQALSDAAASASASTISTTVIAGGSKMTGFFTGKVIAAIAAGVVAVGGVTTAVVLSKNSDKDTSSKTSISASSSSDGSNGGSDNKGGSDVSSDGGYYGDLITDSKGGTYDWGGKKVVIPPKYEEAFVSTDKVCYIGELGVTNPYYGTLTLLYRRGPYYKGLSAEEIRKHFMDNYSTNGIFDFIDGKPTMKSINVLTTKNVKVNGEDFIKETGTYTMTDYKVDTDVIYAAYFGTLDFPDEEKCPVMILLYSTNTDDKKRTEIETSVDNLVKGLEMSDADAAAFAETITNDYKVGYTDAPSFTGDKGTKGDMITSGKFNILLPKYWYADGKDYGSNRTDRFQMHSEKYDMNVVLRLADEHNVTTWMEDERGRMKDENQCSDLSEFTYGKYTWHGIKYKFETYKDQPYHDGFTVVCTTDKSHSIYLQVHGAAYDSDLVNDILSTLTIS